MSISEFYESQAGLRETGAHIDGRVRKAARMFKKHLERVERLLDLGCGVGTVGLYLQETLKVEEVYGVEISKDRVAVAQQKGIKAVKADLNHEPLPFEGNTFDAIFCGEIIEHLVDVDHLLDEIERTLKPGGVCIITTPNLAVWYNRIALSLGWQPFSTSVSFRYEVGRPKFLVSDYGCRDHLRVFTFRALRELLMARGCRILDVEGCSLSEVIAPSVGWDTRRLRTFIYRLIYPLDSLLSRSPSLSTTVVVAFAKGSDAAPGAE